MTVPVELDFLTPGIKPGTSLQFSILLSSVMFFLGAQTADVQREDERHTETESGERERARPRPDKNEYN